MIKWEIHAVNHASSAVYFQFLIYSLPTFMMKVKHTTSEV